MARTNARLIRFAIFAIVLIFCGYILSKGASTSYSSQSKTSNQSKSSTNSGSGSDSAAIIPKQDNSLINNSDKVKATFVSLARNSDLWELVGSIRHIEDRFNRKFQYDWVFLNDEEFNDEFKKVTSQLVSGTTHYGVIPKDQWSFPSWIDVEKAAETRQKMREAKVIYGDSISYRHMCRYESGFFFRHPLLDQYEYYWRVEPGIKIYCDIDYDLFKFMKVNDYKYSFTISLPEYPATIETLWDTVKNFTKENPQYLAEDNMMSFISDDGGAAYNGCHFWSNFEIASLDFWRSEAYMKYFEYLDKAGGFFYERWGDAPVHSIAASLFLPKDQVHFFDDVGYYHVPFHNCPVDTNTRLAKNCMCNPNDDFTWKGWSCTSKYFNVKSLKKPDGWEKYSN